MMQIFLKDLKWIGEHGVSDTEKSWGTNFIVDILLEIDERNSYDHLDHTVDYQQVYELVKFEFSIREKLLENLVMRISERLTNAFPFIHQVEISISKEDPPIKNFSGRVGVKYKKTVAR